MKIFLSQTRFTNQTTTASKCYSYKRNEAEHFLYVIFQTTFFCRQARRAHPDLSQPLILSKMVIPLPLIPSLPNLHLYYFHAWHVEHDFLAIEMTDRALLLHIGFAHSSHIYVCAAPHQ